MAAPAPNRPLVDRHAGARRYFRRWNKTERWKWLLTGGAFVVGLAWLAAAPLAKMLGRPNTDERYTHGPLANPHAAWDANCEVCHVKHSTGEFGWSVWRAGERWRDLTCENCHAGPPHHTSEKWPDGAAASCATCHHDHKGRNFSLTRIPDAHCTSCHDKLNAYHKDGATNYAAEVTDFVKQHPEFRALKDEAAGKAHVRTIKFSHALHLRKGVTTADNPADDRAAVKVNGEYVQLDCASCHTLDAGRKGTGDYFQPVNFDQHCKTCHPLGTAGGSGPAGGIEIPHRKQPSEIERLIEAATALNLGLGKDAPGSTAVPFVRQQPEVTAATLGRLKEATASRVTIVAANCRKCHDADPRTAAIVPVRIPAVWFESAKFNHASHRGSDCKTCHPTDTPIANGKLVEREKINILGIDLCRKCHGPAGGTRTEPAGGVRHGCTDCHTYHNGDHPRQGRGAAARNPSNPKASPVDFLLGTPSPRTRTP